MKSTIFTQMLHSLFFFYKFYGMVYMYIILLWKYKDLYLHKDYLIVKEPKCFGF